MVIVKNALAFQRSPVDGMMKPCTSEGIIQKNRGSVRRTVAIVIDSDYERKNFRIFG
jgi:hypothetical protein